MITNQWLEKRRHGLETIKANQFADYLKNSGANTHCLSCGSAELVPAQTTRFPELTGDPETLTPDELAAELEEHGDFVSYRFLRCYYVDAGDGLIGAFDCQFQVACKNCGFVSRHLASKVLGWLEKDKDIGLK
ncbi:hypothetical protein [Rahnella sp. ChDrAdgB13]|uniref:hypothetical protein n=1 Tax=Rahnella sp. ChDrAdgB13 TaxID=1850581 RepID=UPI001AD87959|nr:hypothetical protein [Rahnella sp. ChDrAdgB13]